MRRGPRDDVEGIQATGPAGSLPGLPRTALDQAISALLVTGVALRPLIWDGDPWSPSAVAFLLIQAAGPLLGLLDRTPDRRYPPSWALPAVALVAALLVAAARAGNPALGWGMVLPLVVQLAWTLWLARVVRGREGLLWGALVAGLLVEAVLALVQPLTVFPALRALVDGGPGGAAPAAARGDLLERLEHGGLYGTFTLSNTLAGYLLLVGPALAWTAWDQRRRPWPWLVLGLAGAAFLGTSSKAAWLIVPVLVLAAWARAGGRRIMVLGVAAALTAAVAGLAAALPGIGRGLWDSLAVRLGYWDGAVRLVAEAPWAGHGLGAFADRFPAVMPLWSEPTRYVHCEVLEAVVALGLPLALLLPALVVSCLRWPPIGNDLSPLVVPGPIPPAVPVVLVGACAYLALLGGFDGNLDLWPGAALAGGGTDRLAVAGWAALLGILAALALAVFAHPRPPPEFLGLGLLGLALHALVDFDLHSPALVGTAGVVAVLTWSHDVWHSKPSLGRAPAVAAALAGLVAALAMGALGGRLRGAEELVAALRAAASGDPARIGVLAEVLGQPAPTDAAGGRVLVAAARQAVMAEAALDPALAVRGLAALPPNLEVLEDLDRLGPRLPWSSAWAGTRAGILMDLGRLPDAAAAAREAVARAPWHLPLRQRLAAILERAAQRDPGHAGAWRAEAAAVRAEIDRLAPLVHPRSRPHPAAGR